MREVDPEVRSRRAKFRKKEKLFAKMLAGRELSREERGEIFEITPEDERASKTIQFTLKAEEQRKTLDKKTKSRLNLLLNDIFEGGRRGMPETLIAGEGMMSRRLNKHDRLVYKFVGTTLEVLQVGGHYDD